MDFRVSVAPGNTRSGAGAVQANPLVQGRHQPLRPTTEEVLSSPSFGEVERNLHNRFARLSLPRDDSENR